MILDRFALPIFVLFLTFVSSAVHAQIATFVRSFDYGSFQASGIETDDNGNIYLLGDRGSQIGVHIFDNGGNSLSSFGSLGDGPGQFHEPIGIASGQNGNLFVADSLNSRIQVFDSSGAFQFTANHSGCDRGLSSDDLCYPTGLAVHADNLYVAVRDNEFQNVQLYNTLGEFERAFSHEGRPYGIAVGKDGEIVVSDVGEQPHVAVYDPAGNLVRSFGESGAGAADIGLPLDLEVDDAGNIYVVDLTGHDVKVFDQSGKYRFSFGNSVREGGNLAWPTGIAIDARGSIYVVDQESVKIYEVQLDSALVGDYNNNGLVEQGDLDLVLLHWGSGGVPDSWQSDPPTGAIDQEELDKVLLGWGNTSTSADNFAAVPEPMTAILILPCCACCLLRRRRAANSC